MDYRKYIGKGWSKSSPKKRMTEWYYIIDVKIVNVDVTVKDEDGRTIFDKIPHKKGKGFSTVIRRETVKRPAILAIKHKLSSDSSRRSITNPTAGYAVNDAFFNSLERETLADNLANNCLKYLFENGFERWKKHYSGYKNLLS